MTAIDRACPKCRESGGDSTGNHFFLMRDEVTWFCRKCNYKESDVVSPYILQAIQRDAGTFKIKAGGGASVVSDEIRKPSTNNQLAEIAEYPVMPVKGRKLNISSSNLYNVKGSVHCETGEVDTYYYPITSNGKLIGYKVKPLSDKKMYTVGAIKGQDLDFFGQYSACGKKATKKLVITEGEEDALAAHQMLSKGFDKIEYNVVSLPLGAGNLKCLDSSKAFLDRFDEIIVCTDQDEPGKKAAAAISALYPEKAKVMVFDEKDACDMLAAGKEKVFVNAYFSAKCHAPDNLVTVEDVYEDAIKMPEWGRLWPWPTLNDYTYGRRDGEGIYVAAGVKAGKTEWLSQMVHHITEVEGLKVLLIKFEQSNDATVKAVAGKIMKRNFTVPDGPFTQAELIEGVNKTKGKLLMFDAYMNGNAQQNNMWDRLKPVIRHAVLVEGIKDIFIDPITQLTDGMTASDTDVELRRFSNELAGLAKELGFFYYCFAHLKAPNTGKTHEDGGDVRVAQMRGSRAMIEKTKYALGIIRNQYAEDPIERNTSTFHLLLNSGFGRTGQFDVYYNPEDSSYLELTNEYT